MCDKKCEVTIIRLRSGSNCLCQFQTVIDLVQVIASCPMGTGDTISHEARIALLAKTDAPLRSTHDCQNCRPGTKDTHCKIIAAILQPVTERTHLAPIFPLE